MDYTELTLELLQVVHTLQKEKRPQKMRDSTRGSNFILQYTYIRGEDVLPSEISTEMGISTARIAAALNNLEGKGLISRRIDPNDRRRILVSLTDEGRNVAEEDYQLVHHHIGNMLRSLGEQDAKDFVRILRKISEMK